MCPEFTAADPGGVAIEETVEVAAGRLLFGGSTAGRVATGEFGGEGAASMEVVPVSVKVLSYKFIIQISHSRA